MNSVITLETFNIKNQAYQLKFIGNMFLNLRHLNHIELAKYEGDIKIFVLKTVIKYGLRVYKNIMITENWSSELENIKVDVAFERVNKSKNKDKAVSMIKECISTNLNVYVNSLNSHPERVDDLENLLGSGKVGDQEVL